MTLEVPSRTGNQDNPFQLSHVRVPPRTLRQDCRTVNRRSRRPVLSWYADPDSASSRQEPIKCMWLRNSDQRTSNVLLSKRHKLGRRTQAVVLFKRKVRMSPDESAARPAAEQRQN